ncbi:AMP-binding protein [Pseudomonas sp. X10]
MKTKTSQLPERRPHLLASGAWNDKIITEYWDIGLKEAPERTALVAYRVGEEQRTEMTRRELDRHVTRIAVGLAAMGVEKGDVVSCQLPNWWQMFALHLACVRIGAVLNPLMPIFRERELRFILDHAQSRVLVVAHSFRGFNYAEMANTLSATLPRLEHVLTIGGDDSFAKLLLERAWEQETDVQALFDTRRPHADDVVQLLYTSGTTGEPKGVLHSSNTLFANVRPYAERLHLNSDDIVFMASPMAHQTGFLYGLMMPVYLQATAVLQDTWDPHFAVRVAAAERPTFTMASTPFLADLVEIAPQHRTAMASLRVFAAAGAPIPSILVEKAASAIEARIVSAWGMSETGAVTMTYPEDEVERAIHTDGCALPYMEVRVLDDQGQTAGPGIEGHLMVRGASLFIGYLKRPEWYAVDSEGWFDTGDLAQMDERGYIRITGRTKDVVIRGGENIPVVEVENLIYAHPAVTAVALVGFPDERLGERVCAYVTLHDGEPDLSLDALVEFLLAHRLSKNYLPEHLEVLPALPRTPSGKIQKFKLRELARDIRLNPARSA